jgi:hypothetical protein
MTQLNIKNPDVQQLLHRLIAITGESKVSAIKAALEMRLASLQKEDADVKMKRTKAWLESQVFPFQKNNTGMPSKAEEEDYFGHDY